MESVCITNTIPLDQYLSFRFKRVRDLKLAGSTTKASKHNDFCKAQRNAQ